MRTQKGTHMNLDSTVSTMAASIPQELDRMVHHATSYIPDALNDAIWHASSYLPTQIDFITVAKFLLYFTAASLILSVLGRVVLGKRSSLNRALSSVMGILFIYAVTIVVYTFKPWELEIFLSPLPFVTFSGNYLIVLPITDLQFSALCTQVLSLIILAFLVNLSDIMIPQGKNLVSWYLLRLIGVVLSMMLHLIVCWAFEAYLPEVLVHYAPTILLILLGIMVLSGALSLILGLVISVMNPLFGAMYTFFFSNVIGKQISKAIFSTAIVCGVLYLIDYFGYTVISIAATSLLTYIPLALVLLVLWYLIGHLL